MTHSRDAKRKDDSEQKHSGRHVTVSFPVSTIEELAHEAKRLDRSPGSLIRMAWGCYKARPEEER